MTETATPPESRGLRRYVQQDMRADAVAGLTVAVMGVPQAMAYALIAGLPPVYGLYTAIVTCAVAALLGSSNHLVTGPTNALCMVMLSLTAHLTERYPQFEVLELILLLTFMTGVIQLAFGLLRLGGIVRYVSHSVVIGFTAGAGILIALNQLKNILGIDIAAHAERSYEVFWQTVKHAGDTNPYALAVGGVTALIVIFAPKLNKKLPGALIAIGVTGGLSYVLGWHLVERGDLKIDIVRDIPPGVTGGLDIFHVPQLITAPHYELTRELATGAVALAFLGLIEAASIARAVAASAGQRVDFTREFVGQGASNVVGSFFSCFAGSGSFTRTAVCYQSGGRTRMAATFSAIFTGLTLLLLGPVADYIPKAALAGILIVIAYSMIDKERLKKTWRSGPNARLVLGGTFASTLVLPLEWAIYVGVFLSLAILLRTTGTTDLTQLIPRDHGFDEVPFQRAAPSPVVTVNMEGDLYFAAAEDLDAELLKCLTPQTLVVVLRMKRLRAVGSSAMSMLEHFEELLRARSIALVVSGIEKELEDVMTRTGVRAMIGELNIFYADNKLFQSTELALARAWSVADQRARLAREAGRIEPSQRRHLSASDVMTTRCIRFGNQHQLREAVWLISELNKHTNAISPEPLFLQDREGKLFGELSPWRVLSALAAGTRDVATAELDDAAVAELLRRDFAVPIKGIARTDVQRHTTQASLAALLEASVVNDQHVIPICDSDGRIKGLVSTDDLLRGLSKALAKANGGDGDA